MLRNSQRAKLAAATELELRAIERSRWLPQACCQLTAAVQAVVTDASKAFIRNCLDQMLDVIYEGHTAQRSGQLAD